MPIRKTDPAVFAVGKEYQIFVPVTVETLMWVQVGEDCFYDDSNGILRSGRRLHRMTLPQSLLDSAKAYTLCYRVVRERKPYFSDVDEVITETFSFRPVSNAPIRAFHIGDAHNMVNAPVAAARVFEKRFGPLDFLILNGDVPDHSGSIENFDNIYEIVGRITHGAFPAVFSRGNHDTRGIFAEAIAEYTPTRDGHSFYSFRLGSIWGLILDCGEDKPDGNPEYGHTICCHAFRLRESRYLEAVIAHAREEYSEPGISHRLVICHNPFTMRYPAPFNIEEDLYSRWAQLLAESVKPDLMIGAHTHRLLVSYPGDTFDALGQPCPLVVGAEPRIREDYYAGAGFIFENDTIQVAFTDSLGCLLDHRIL